MEIPRESVSFGDFIANLVFKKYNNLVKKGKPQNCEWTILAAIVMSTNEPAFASSNDKHDVF
jgi:hypothetical protein